MVQLGVGMFHMLDDTWIPKTESGQLPDTAWVFVAKLLGAVAGSAISIAYILPRGRREAACRFFTGLIAGLIFGTTIGHKMANELDLGDALGSFELTVAGAALASLCAWWALGVMARLAERASGKH